jgi:hypothetical protein
MTRMHGIRRMGKEAIMEKWSVKGLALGAGVLWGLSMLILGWIAASGWGKEFVNVLGSFYIGFQPGFVGGIIGGIWGFCDGAIGGGLLALFYNAFATEERVGSPEITGQRVTHAS